MSVATASLGNAWRSLLTTAFSIALAGCNEPNAPLTVPLVQALGDTASATRYARAESVREFRFPADHGPHPDFRNEWWYFTGNLRAADGRRFGYQLTFFRFAISPLPAPVEGSAWRSHQLYLAHFALSDIDGKRFHAFERRSRAALGMAGAQADPFVVWVDNWSARADGGSFTPRLQASAETTAIDLSLAPEKPIVRQGDRGLSQKDSQPGNASYYYSLTRMRTAGEIVLDGQAFDVEGTSWMDREWSTSALGPEQVGWDWFALQFSDGRELMYYRLRRSDGGVDPHSAGVLVANDGSTTALDSGAVILEALAHWQSPRSGSRYPARWHLRVPSADLELDIQALLTDQELPLSVHYWEGAVGFYGQAIRSSPAGAMNRTPGGDSRFRHRASGGLVSGVGYVELVGYGTTR
jgi:predicted secreted hydrolase